LAPNTSGRGSRHRCNGKEVWLNLPFMAARTIFGLLLLFGVSLAFAYTALRPDMGYVRDRVPARLRPINDWFARNWRGQEAEELHAHRRLLVLAPAAALIYAVVMGVLAWDFIMSLEPHWFSTLIGPYFFMGAILGGVMTTALITMAVRPAGPAQLDPAFNAARPRQARVRLHDLLGLHVLLAVHRDLVRPAAVRAGVRHSPLRAAVPHHCAARWLLLFVIPFFGLLSVAAKRTPAIFQTFAVISLLGLWLERWLLVYPSLWIGAETLPLSWQEPACCCHSPRCTSPRLRSS
jgi:Ni/Fe-hydrogenase subunit HybB-like protein